MSRRHRGCMLFAVMSRPSRTGSDMSKWMVLRRVIVVRLLRGDAYLCASQRSPGRFSAGVKSMLENEPPW
jgi:hypothetical protein